MNFTDYGINLADNERTVGQFWLQRSHAENAELLREQVNRDHLILVTGNNDFRAIVHSVVSAFAHAETNPNVRFAWHLIGDGSRRLVFRA